MMNPDPYKRPNVDSILATKKIQDILVKRRMVRPFIKIVSFMNLFAGMHKVEQKLKFSCHLC